MAYQVDPALQQQRTQFLNSKTAEANQAANNAIQTGDDALQRRFTSMGAANSGAAIAAQQKNQDAGEQLRRQGIQDVNNQQLQFGQQDADKAFQSNEAEIGRQFQGGLAANDMAFKQGLANTDQSNKLKELDLAQQQFSLDKDTTAFNEKIAQIEQNRVPDKGIVGDITSGLGGITEPIKKVINNPVGTAKGSLIGGAIPGVGPVLGGLVGGGK